VGFVLLIACLWLSIGLEKLGYFADHVAVSYEECCAKVDEFVLEE